MQATDSSAFSPEAPQPVADRGDSRSAPTIMLTLAGRFGLADVRLRTVWLVFALATVSATRLRLASVPVGLGELMLLAWLLSALPGTFSGPGRPNRLQRLLLRFWVPVGVLLALGAVWAHTHDVYSPGAVHDTVALTFAATFGVVIAGAVGTQVPVLPAIRWTVGTLTVYLGLLALIHAVAPGLVTVVDFGDRLTGLTENPNQLALYLAPLPFLATYLLASATTTRARVLLLAAVALELFAGRAVGSDALALTWLAGALASLVMIRRLRRRRGSGPNDRLVIMALVAIMALGAAGLVKRYSPQEMRADVLGALDDRPGGCVVTPSGKCDWEKTQITTRAALWRSGFEVISMAPLAGFGPGRHAGNGVPFQGNEVHNSFLDLATMAGIPAALLFAWLLWSIASPKGRLGKEGYVACVIVGTVTLFASLHFMLRQPIFWFYLVLAGALRQSDD